MYWMLGIPRDFRAFFWLRVFSVPRQSSRLPQPTGQVRERKPLGNYSQKFVFFFVRLSYFSLVIEFEFGKSKPVFSGGILQVFGFQQKKVSTEGI
jgi:hypothetical protein